jgi:recombinational DNA repair ATPase RecF
MGTDKAGPTSIAEVQTSQAMLLSFPLVYKDDILVELDTNRRWIVVSSKSTELLRNDIHQDIIVSRLPESDKVYDIEVPSCYHQSIS